MKRRVRWLWVALFLAAATQSSASESLRIGGGSAQVQLQFRIVVPQILYLQVGREKNSVDLIEFLVTEVPWSGKVIGRPEGIPVRVAGQIPRGQSLNLTVDSTRPLTSGSTNIPFNTISWSGTGDFEQGTFNGTTNQKIGRWNASGDRRGKYTFSYDNRQQVPPGIYSGHVTYTLSCP